MSLAKILSEFSDPQIPKDIVKKVNSFEGVKNISLREDYPTGGKGAQAFAYFVENEHGGEFILRIAKGSDMTGDRFDKFVDNNYPNIVDVYFAREISNKSVSVMEYLPKEVKRNNIRNEALDKMFHLQYNARKDLKNMLVDREYSTFFFDTKIKHHKHATEQTELRKDLFELYEGSTEARHFIDDIIQGLDQYKQETNEIYLDLHRKNVRGTKHGLYKLIDL